MARKAKKSQKAAQRAATKKIRPKRDPEEILSLLREIRRLMWLNDDNPFKIKAFERGVDVLGDCDDLLERVQAGTLTELPGIGKGISETIEEYVTTGESEIRDELFAALPEGMVDLVRIQGVGPKKARTLIEKLEVRSVGELEYACHENRLLKLKGFGQKEQDKILASIQFLKANRGQARWVDVSEYFEKFKEVFQKEAEGVRWEVTGPFRRRLEVLNELDILAVAPKGKFDGKEFVRFGPVPVKFHYTTEEKFGFDLARTTGSPAHWKKLKIDSSFEVPTEEAFYERIGLRWIPPEMRETGEEIALAKKGKLESVLPWKGIRGVFHVHTLRSDGSATLEAMVRRASELGYEYIGVSDHSQSAGYAGGLKAAELNEQEKEVRTVQEKFPEIRIFWGVESDIRKDGSLDYPDSVLKKFDFVIASIHSRFKNNRQEMTRRLIAAARNPHTRFMGHITGRLLLGREPYDVDLEKVIETAAKSDVAIEINASPARLDIDWRWGKTLRKSGALVSVHPDAHSIAGLSDTHFGVGVARKGLMPLGGVLNSRSAGEVEKWLRREH